MNKKIYTVLIISMFLCITGFAQNLVNNPGFENITGNCAFAGYSSLVDWYNPDPIDSCSTPDWFATCVISPFTKAPNSQMGYQQPHGGTAYAGFISYDQTTTSYREYAEGSLSTALTAAASYKVTMFISLANASHFSVNHLGIYFSNTQVSTTAYNCPALYPLAYTPQIDTTFTITDTANWIPLTWQYTATGGERYFTIGNFHNDAGTTTTPMPHSLTSLTPFAYYFIDDISIMGDTTAVDTTDTTNPEGLRNAYYNSMALKMYPSPANTYVNIECTGMTEISIINNMGMVVYKGTKNTNKETIDISNMPNGLYMVRVQTSQGLLVRKLEVFK